MSHHKHAWGGWAIHRPADLSTDIPDNEVYRHTSFTPFWKRACACGHEEWIRMQKRPKANLKLKNYRGVRLV